MNGAALRVAVVAGGPSSEAAVSRVSAAAVGRALRDAGHQVTAFELDHNLPAQLAASRAEVVFPVLHGPLGEDGCVQGLFEVLGLAYVGSGVLASALAASKPHAKAQFRQAQLPVAEQALVHAYDDLETAARRAREELGPAVVVKPGSGGSAIGVTRVQEQEDLPALVQALAQALTFDNVVLIERFVKGFEVTCGVLENEAGVAEALPPTLISAKAADWYDFRSRYGTLGSSHQCPAPFPRELLERIQSVAVQAHRALGARDLSRVDFVVSEHDPLGPVVLLELNTLPGMTATSLFPEAAAVAGIPFVELCDRLVRRAQARPARAAPPVMSMPE
jgi:D-alanine-D-alanine ligase